MVPQALQTWFPWALAGTLLALLLGQVGRLRRLRSQPKRRMERARIQGAAGEARAPQILREAGYRVIAHQPEAMHPLRIDGSTVTFPVRADFLVARGGQRFVADAKTGASARLSHRGTRRQLLEYALAYEVHGVLLVDADAGTVSRLELPPRRVHWPVLVAALLVGAALGGWVHARWITPPSAQAD